MKNYNYTQRWFSCSDLKQFLPVGTQDELHILEIGSFEGESTVWFIENFLNNQNSTITCIDPWISYNQKKDSLNSYGNILQKDLQDLSEGYIFSNENETFLKNIIETGKLSQTNIIKGFSNIVLPNLISIQKKYNIIYIDGNHTSPAVLSDAVMSWWLLDNEGIMIFDDYKWGEGKKETLKPKMAIDNFINNYKDYLEVCWRGYRVAIKKIK